MRRRGGKGEGLLRNNKRKMSGRKKKNLNQRWKKSKDRL